MKNSFKVFYFESISQKYFKHLGLKVKVREGAEMLNKI